MKIFVEKEKKCKSLNDKLDQSTIQKRINDYNKVLNSEIIDIEAL